MPGSGTPSAGGYKPQKSVSDANISTKKDTSSAKAENDIRKKNVQGPIDSAFAGIVLLLLAMGLVIMFSAGYAWAIAEGEEGDYYFKRQLGMAVAGLAFMLIASFFDYHYYRHPIIVFGAFAVAVILMLLCLGGPFADPHEDAYRWIKLGPLPSFQPSEILKFSVILMFAYLISINYSKMKNAAHGLFPFLIIFGIVLVLLALQRHYSAIIIICCIGLILMFIGGTRILHLVMLIPLLIAAIAVLIYIKGVTYIEPRVTAWLDPFNPEIMDKTWQIRNSLIAIGSGGMFGLGLGNSRQKFLYLPESKNDFVFAIVCEEFGFVGAMIVIICFIVLIVRGFRIASNAPDKFGMILAAGISAQIGIQAILNIAVVTGAFPNTGVSLPFFSYGGTALIMLLAQMGIVLNISRHSTMKK